MSKIRVYFNDYQKATFDADKVVFESSDGMFSAMGEAFPADGNSIREILSAGKAVVNWHNVCFVRQLSMNEEKSLNVPDD